MKVFVFLIICILSVNAYQGENKTRVINYQGTDVNTTFDVPQEFIGFYRGRKTGYLELRADGTGEYKYDIFGLAPASCERKAIQFNWGLILDDNGEILKNKRDYGFSFPFLMESTGSNSFQGCRTPVMQDFILRKGETLHISSSDDWEKPLK